MARVLARLSSIQINNAQPRIDRCGKPAGKFYADGGGLWLQVTPAANGEPNKSWVFRYKFYGKERAMGLGPIQVVSIREARRRADEMRHKLRSGVDPLAERDAKRIADRLAAAKNKTFDWCAEQYINVTKSTWKNPKHENKWRQTIGDYASPIFGNLPVAQVDETLVLQAIDPIWDTKRHTATRLRGMIEMILAWATVRGLRQGENPARGRGHLYATLPGKKTVEHYNAIHYREVAELMARLGRFEPRRQGTEGRFPDRQEFAVPALQMLILTAVRIKELMLATRSEFDFEARLWIIPAEHMKMEKEHRVPLAPRALEILLPFKDCRDDELMFAGFSSNTLRRVFKQIVGREYTVHGLRATHRTWAAEETNFSTDVCEAAIAHYATGTEGAYNRGALLEKRRKLMERWAVYCCTPATERGKVLPIAGRMLSLSQPRAINAD